MDQKILGLITPDMGVNSLAQIQESTLTSLHNANRLQRMIEIKSAHPDAYGIEDLYGDLRNSIFAELKSGRAVSVHRRNLQRIYVGKLIEILNPKAEEAAAPSFFGPSLPAIDPMKNDIAAVTRGTLMELHEEIVKKAKASGDKLTQYHLEDCAMRIQKGLGLDD